MTVEVEISGTTGSAHAGGARPRKRVAFILSQFPETHETFILREFVGLEEAGLDFVIFSLKPCRDRIVQKDATRFLDRTWYPARGSPGAGAIFRPRVTAAAMEVLPWTRSPLKSAYVSWAAGVFAGLARRLGVVHLHAHWATAPASAAALMSEMLGMPWSLTAHAWDIYAGDGKLAAKARRAAFIATCTRANVEHLKSILPRDDWDKVILSYHGIPIPTVERSSRPRDGVFEIVAAGRLVETKGFEYLVAAAAQLDFPFHITIIGDGPLRGRLETKSGDLGLGGRISFAGTVPNEEVYRLLSRADAFVMPSVIAGDGDRDGIPNVLLEAMSVGLPVIASSVSGIPEAVADERTGLLVPERDSSAIARALTGLRGDGDRARRLGAAARDWVRLHFDARANAHALYDVFCERLGRAAE